MDKQNVAIVVAVVALIIALFVALQPAPQVIAGITYDPTAQPSVLPLRELTASSAEAASGIFMDYQKINTTGGTGSPYIGEVVFLDGSTWIRADPGSAATLAGKLGMVVKAPSSNVTADGQVLMLGVVRNSSWTLTKGDVLYANTTTPGTFSNVKPADGTTMIQPIGWVYNTSVVYFNPPINATANGL